MSHIYFLIFHLTYTRHSSSTNLFPPSQLFFYAYLFTLLFTHFIFFLFYMYISSLNSFLLYVLQPSHITWQYIAPIMDRLYCLLLRIMVHFLSFIPQSLKLFKPI